MEERDAAGLKYRGEKSRLDWGDPPSLFGVYSGGWVRKWSSPTQVKKRNWNDARHNLLNKSICLTRFKSSHTLLTRPDHVISFTPHNNITSLTKCINTGLFCESCEIRRVEWDDKSRLASIWFTLVVSRLSSQNVCSFYECSDVTQRVSHIEMRNFVSNGVNRRVKWRVTSFESRFLIQSQAASRHFSYRMSTINLACFTRLTE